MLCDNYISVHDSLGLTWYIVVLNRLPVGLSYTSFGTIHRFNLFLSVL